MGTEADPVGEPEDRVDGEDVDDGEDLGEGPPQSTFAWWDIWDEDQERKRPLRQLPSIVGSASGVLSGIVLASLLLFVGQGRLTIAGAGAALAGLTQLRGRFSGMSYGAAGLYDPLPSGPGGAARSGPRARARPPDQAGARGVRAADRGRCDVPLAGGPTRRAGRSVAGDPRRAGGGAGR